MNIIKNLFETRFKIFLEIYYMYNILHVSYLNFPAQISCISSVRYLKKYFNRKEKNHI